MLIDIASASGVHPFWDFCRTLFRPCRHSGGVDIPKADLGVSGFGS